MVSGGEGGTYSLESVQGFPKPLSDQLLEYICDESAKGIRVTYWIIPNFKNEKKDLHHTSWEFIK